MARGRSRPSQTARQRQRVIFRMWRNLPELWGTSKRTNRRSRLARVFWVNHGKAFSAARCIHLVSSYWFTSNCSHFSILRQIFGVKPPCITIEFLHGILVHRPLPGRVAHAPVSLSGFGGVSVVFCRCLGYVSLVCLGYLCFGGIGQVSLVSRSGFAGI